MERAGADGFRSRTAGSRPWLTSGGLRGVKDFNYVNDLN